MSKYVKPVLSYSADTVWAAACAAQRVNGSYIKPGEVDPYDSTSKLANRTLIDNILAGNEFAIEVTDADRTAAIDVRKFFQAYTFKILQGVVLGEFDSNAMSISNRDTLTTNYEIAVIACLPSSYERGTVRATVDQRIKFARGGFVGVPNDKVKLSVEVLKSIFSQTWNIFYVTGITDDDQVIFFGHKTGQVVGSKLNVSGTVKAHRDDSTQLNRVKIT